MGWCDTQIGKRNERGGRLMIPLEVAVDAAGKELGTVYLDVDHRAGKNLGDCHYTVRCSKQVVEHSSFNR